VTIGIFVFANANSFTMLLLSQVIVAIGSCTGFVGAGYVGGKWFGMAKFSFMFAGAGSSSADFGIFAESDQSRPVRLPDSGLMTPCRPNPTAGADGPPAAGLRPRPDVLSLGE
jgi:hypothetical protein